MTAEDYALLEARVAELERLMRNVLPHKIDALAHALSLVHEDVRAFRATVTAHDGRFDEIDARITVGIDGQFADHDARFDSIDATLTDHGRLLAEILRRLPAEPEGSDDP